MSKLKNLIGMKFGRLTVIERAENTKGGKARWLCRCDCSNYTVVDSSSLQGNKTKSCGCLNKEHTGRLPTHGKSNTPIYRVWSSMLNRCYNPNNPAYKNYGGRGITVCPEWIDNFQAFYNYVSELPHFGEKGCSLDRIDNSGNYEPDNVRWANQKMQDRNKRSNRILEYNGKLMTLIEAAEKSGIKYSCLKKRYQRGDTGERLFRPVKNH